MQFIFNFLNQLLKTKPAAKRLAPTYVLATSINNPASLFVDTTLADPKEGFYICSNEQPFSSAVAYIDVSNITRREADAALLEFLDSLQDEVRKTGALTKRGDWNAF